MHWRAGSLVYTSAGLFSLFFWLLWGDFAYYVKDRSVPPAMQLLLDHLHASNLVIGILLVSLPAVTGLFVMPVVAYHSDRHRGRWGRRIPFLAAPIPFTFIAMLGLAFSPLLGREIHGALGRWSPGENDCVIIALAGSWILFEVCTSICNAVFLSLIADVVPREVIGRFYAWFRMVSLLAGIIFFYSIFGHIEAHYFAVFLGIGALYCIGFTAMCVKVKEGSYPPPAAVRAPGASPNRFLRSVVPGVRAYCRACFALSYYRWVFLSFALTIMAGASLNSFYVLYAKSFNMNMATLGKYGALELFLSLLQAYPIGWLADRFHPLRVTIATMVILDASTLAAFFLVHDAASFGISLVVCGTLAGAWLTASASLPAVLFPASKFAMLDSARLTTSSIGVVIAGPLCGWMLDFLHRDFSCLYLWWGAIQLLAILATLVVYQKFLRCGGLVGYAAPE